MVDTYYLKDAVISAVIFRSETVPGDNTINETSNDLLKELAQDEVFSIHKWDISTAPDLSVKGNGKLRNITLRIYAALRDGDVEKSVLTKDEENFIVDRYSAVSSTGNAPLKPFNPETN